MTDSTTTTFSNRCSILGDFWVAYKDDNQFRDFVRYSDIALPLAYMLSTNMVSANQSRGDYMPTAEEYINEAWDTLLALLELDDEGFQSLDDIIATDIEEE